MTKESCLMTQLEKGYTTLNIIKSYSPSDIDLDWKLLLSGLNKTKADDEPLHILKILEINGWRETRWAFKCFEGIDEELQLFAADCAESVLHLYQCKLVDWNKPGRAIKVARRFMKGEEDEGMLRLAFTIAVQGIHDAHTTAANYAAFSVAAAIASNATTASIWDDAFLYQFDVNVSNSAPTFASVAAYAAFSAFRFSCYGENEIAHAQQSLIENFKERWSK